MKIGVDILKLMAGQCYRVDRETPVMIDPNPIDPMFALERAKLLEPGQSFTVLFEGQGIGPRPWYRVTSEAGDGWINEAALVGQLLEVEDGLNP